MAKREYEIEEYKREVIKILDVGIAATGTSNDYMTGMVNGIKWAKSVVDGKDPQYAKTDKEIVKPYLDKLRAEVEERLSMIMFDDYGNETPDHAEFICILDEILKGEEGEK